ncbi:MAG TPA: organomercurial lyase [Ktedonosporobacter sp.]|nr:organomercurial lyase [Ktedonosporobacter sp.]
MTTQTVQKALTSYMDFFTAHAEQFRLWLPLWQLLAEGSPVRLPRLASLSQRSLNEIQAELPSLDVRLDEEGNILASGLSLVQTRHQLHVGEQTLYTWCALDTLAFPPVLGRPARVISSCPATGKAIRLTVTPEAISDLSEAGAVVSVRLPGEETNLCHVQEDICNDGYFFVSHEVASAWPSLHPSAVLLDVEEAAALGRALASTIRSLAG